MSEPLIVIDPGHGRGNRRPGVFDPGCVRVNGAGAVEAREADLALAYGSALADEFKVQGSKFKVMLTREDNQKSVSLKDRVEIARQNQAGLLVSLHMNAAPPAAKGVVAGLWPASDRLEACNHRGKARPNRARGFEVLYSTASSALFAHAIRDALKDLAGKNGCPTIPPHGEGIVRRNGLRVLRYDPSVLIEAGFLDNDQDYALLADASWRQRAMEAVAKATVGLFDTGAVQSSKFKVQSPEVAL